ncbi:MAG: hypothetical protein ACPG3T_06820 [Pseudomonadales bacterium]
MALLVKTILCLRGISMGGLFSPKTPAPPPPDPEITAAQERQEERLEADEQQKMRAIAARRRARATGGARMLLSKARQNAETGIQSTLGGGV